MNAERRKQIESIAARLSDIKADLESVRDAEQDALDNMPPSFQQGDKGEAAQQAIDNLDSAISALEDIDSTLEEARQ